MRALGLSFGLLLVVAVSLTALPTSALASCGDIIFEQDHGDGPEDEREAIGDCSNPFNADFPVPFEFELIIAEQTISQGSVVVVTEGLENSLDFSIKKTGNFVSPPLQLFRQEGDDYRNIYNVREDDKEIGPLEEGEYVAVFLYEESPVPVDSGSSWKKFLREILLPPVALAYFPNSTEVAVVSFSVEYETIEPTGASSVLFLPGIQASRLYTEGLFGSENQLWEPNRNNDVEALVMTEEGISINDIYTKEVVDEINVTPFLQGNIYKSFLEQMEDLKTEEVIKDFIPFAYDWRYSVFDIAKNDVLYPDDQTKKLLDEVLALAEDSYTGKVTLIGHSNGGLVAKALLEEYGDNLLSGKVDKLVMIGAPQLGTPKAIGSMLHGLDQSLGLGLIATASNIRQVTKNLLGAYTLLPSARYFDEVDESVITTDGSGLASSVSDYGEINSASRLHNFLANSLDNRNEVSGLNNPLILNQQILSEAFGYQDILDNWQAPAGVEVYEVVGTGLATIKGIEYREYSCRETNPHCILNSYLKPFPIMSNQGDQTVMEISAEGYGGDKVVAKVDLKKANEGVTSRNREHKDLTESDVVQEFIESVIKYPYLSDSVPVPEFTTVSNLYRIISAHSPVSLLATDEEGNQVGVNDGEVTEEIVGSQYFELGDSKYLVIPNEAEVTLEISGMGEGIYTLEVDEINGAGKQNQVSRLVATTSPNMKAEFSIENDQYSLLQIDQDGDGVIDSRLTLDGEVVVEPEATYSYTDLVRAVENLGLKNRYERPLLNKVLLAKSLSKKSDRHKVFARLETATLKILTRTLDLYERKGIVTEGDTKSVKEIINNLN